MKTLDTLQEPLAIAMWDSSWLRRRYRGGGFEDWDKALCELVERGYNAVRLDVFPHLIAPSPAGEIVEVFKDVPNQYPQFYGLAMWGNPWTMYIRPRQALVEFMTKCREYGVKVGLATWFKPTDDRRNEQIEGVQEFIRVWDQTLEFIDAHGLMDTVVYLDLLNEYPEGHCLKWFHKMLGTMTQPRATSGRLNAAQLAFVRDFLGESIDALRAKWPTLSIATSLTWKHLDEYFMQAEVPSLDFLADMDFLDVHIWITQNSDFCAGTDYHTTIAQHGNPHTLFSVERSGGAYAGLSERIIPADYHYDEVYRKMLTRWREDKDQWTRWYAQTLDTLAGLARQYDCHLGQTEAWGPVNWTDHPLLEWDIHREAAQIGVQLAAERGYLFDCSSNFCHPHFLGFWEDPEWHQQITSIIRGATPWKLHGQKSLAGSRT